MAISIPGYRLTSRLGKGGMSHVFLATQHSFDRQVAIKILTPTLALEPRFAERFMQEARTIASLNHPHIVPVYDVGEYQGYYYLTMEHVTGGSLKQRLASGALDERSAQSILRQLAGALNYASEHGFIHRDVKPDNVLFRADGSALLVDFGIASNVLRDTSVTESTAIMGTPKYMSPEQHRCQPLTPQSDLYSLGCVLYEMLAGKPPFGASDARGMGLAHLRDPIPLLPLSLRRYQPLIRQLLAKEPTERPKCGNTVISLLDNLTPNPEHYSAPRSHYRSKEPDTTAAPLATRLRLKESKLGMSWRGTVYQYDIYLVADDFEQFQSHFPVMRSALMDWFRQRGKRAKLVTIKATLHPWISGRVKQYLQALRKTEGLEFLAAIPMNINLVGSDGDPIEKLAWGPVENNTTGTQEF